MSRWYADIWSHPGHYLVDTYTWPWSPNGHGHEWPNLTPLFNVNVNRPSNSEVQLFESFTQKILGQGHVCGQRSRSHLTLKIQSQGHGQGQTHWSHLRPGVQSTCLFSVSWQSDHFWLRYSKFNNWPWKFKVKVMDKVKSDGHIWGPTFSRYSCFSFHGNIWHWKKRSRSQRKSTKI